MSSINHVNASPSAFDTQAGRARTTPAGKPGQATAQRDADSVTLSPQASAQAQPFRADLVQRIRAEIADGTYETTERIERTAEALAERLNNA